MPSSSSIRLSPAATWAPRKSPICGIPVCGLSVGDRVIAGVGRPGDCARGRSNGGRSERVRGHHGRAVLDFNAVPRDASRDGQALFNRLDHAAIYLFIAGSYMPYLLGVLRGGWGWILFCIVWGVAAFGIAAKLLDRLRHPLWSTCLYVAMGWVAAVAAGPLFERLPPQNLGWLVAGGLSYTVSAVVFLLDSKIKYAPFVWHLFVIAGSACHVGAALVRSA